VRVVESVRDAEAADGGVPLMYERVQWVGAVLFAIGLGLFIGALLGPVAGVGVALVVCGLGAVTFGMLKEREVTDGASPPVARSR